MRDLDLLTRELELYHEISTYNLGSFKDSGKLVQQGSIKIVSLTNVHDPRSLNSIVERARCHDLLKHRARC